MKKITETQDGRFVISEHEVWRPGSFADRGSAELGSQLTDEQLSALMALAGGESLAIYRDGAYWRIEAADLLLGKGLDLQGAVEDAL